MRVKRASDDVAITILGSVRHREYGSSLPGSTCANSPTVQLKSVDDYVLWAWQTFNELVVPAGVPVHFSLTSASVISPGTRAMRLLPSSAGQGVTPQLVHGLTSVAKRARPGEIVRRARDRCALAALGAGSDGRTPEAGDFLHRNANFLYSRRKSQLTDPQAAWVFLC